MTTRDDDDDLITQATGPGELSASLTARLAAASPEVRAEVASLRAVRSLLDGDAAWGGVSGTDAPPPHLFDAILRAEVAARPDEIRQAMALAQTPPAQKALWARLSSWLLGGGVAVGAALAIVVTMQRGDAGVSAPQAAASAKAGPGLVAPDPSMAANKAAEEPKIIGALAAEGQADRLGGADGMRDDAKPKQEHSTKLPLAGLKKADKKLDTVDMPGEPKDAPARPADDDEAAADVQRGRADAAIGAEPLADLLEEERATNRASSGAAAGAGNAMPPPPAAAPVSPEPAPAQPLAAAPRIVTADEARRAFLARKEEAKRLVQQEANEKAKAKAEPKAVAKSAQKPASKTNSTVDVGDAAGSAEQAREQMARQQRLQGANGMLVTAERELSMRRYEPALDFALRAEALAGSGLGLAPASTQVRAFLGLRRPADAARAASRLTGADVRDPQLRDGMRAGVEAAQQIGDLRLQERLLTRLASKDNDDAASRADAQRRLDGLRAKASAPAARESYDDARK